MRAVRLDTTEGVRWVNPDAVTMFYALDTTQLRVVTVTGTFEVRLSAAKFLALMEDKEWEEAPRGR